MIINSVQYYLELIECLYHKYTHTIPSPHRLFPDTIYPAKFIFRGHSNHDEYELIPGIFRWRKTKNGASISEFSQMEYHILSDFITEACGVEKNIHPQDFLPWLETAQHFSVPTRLLDFTENPLVALYFACVGSPEKDASVWIINEYAYNRMFYGESTLTVPSNSAFKVQKIVSDEITNNNYQSHDNQDAYLQYPCIYKPFYRNERMKSQSSVFMIWAAKRFALTFFMQDEYYMTNDSETTNYSTGILCPVIIPHEKKRDLLHQLNMVGINEKFIYPGLDGIGRFIRNKYSSSWTREE